MAAHKEITVDSAPAVLGVAQNHDGTMGKNNLIDSGPWCATGLPKLLQDTIMCSVMASSGSNRSFAANPALGR